MNVYAQIESNYNSLSSRVLDASAPAPILVRQALQFPELTDLVLNALTKSKVKVPAHLLINLAENTMLPTDVIPDDWKLVEPSTLAYITTHTTLNDNILAVLRHFKGYKISNCVIDFDANVENTHLINLGRLYGLFPKALQSSPNIPQLLARLSELGFDITDMTKLYNLSFHELLN